jgi:DNA-binding transcriptional MerR regulator
MAHEIAKLVLENAGTFLKRTEAVRTALSLGMTIEEIESYLDWFDNARFTSETEPDRHRDTEGD